MDRIGLSNSGDDDSPGIANIDRRRKGFEQLAGEPIAQRPRNGVG